MNGTDDAQALGSWYHQLHFPVKVRLQKLAQGEIENTELDLSSFLVFFLAKALFFFFCNEGG